MKKIFTFILLAAGLAFSASAQNGNYGYNNQDRYKVNQSRDTRYDSRNTNAQNQSRNYGYNNSRQRNDDYNRQLEIDRMNRECDQRIETYRNDRSLNRNERNRRIQEVEYERQQKAKSFGTGMVVGGIAAILLGVLFAHGK